MSITWQFGVKLIFEQPFVYSDTTSIEEDFMDRYISNRVQDIRVSDINECLNDGAQKLDGKIGCNVVKKITSLEFIFIKKKPLSLRASSYVPTPLELAKKKAIINIKNKLDDKCFLYSVVCALKYTEIDHTHPDRPLQYTRFFDQYVYDNDDFPMKICNIAKFEKHNNVSINVLRWHDKPLNDIGEIDDENKVTATQNPFISREYLSHHVGEDVPIINLLILGKETQSHYTWIKNLDRLMNFNKGKTAFSHIKNRHWCPQCFRTFRSNATSCLHLSHSLSTYVPTPNKLVNKKVILNIKNERDNKCFLYSVISALKYNEIDHTHPYSPQQYMRYFNQYVYANDDFPMKICNIAKFEKNNNVSINVLRWHDKPLNDIGEIDDENKVTVTQNPFISREYMSHCVGKNVPVINLLILENERQSHYTWIKNLDKLMNLRADNLASCSSLNRYWCPHCFRAFTSNEKRCLHENLCLKLLKFGHTVYNIASETHLEFREWQKTIPIPYVVYADFRCIVKQCDGNDQIQKHEPIMASYLLVPQLIHNEQPLPMRYEHFYGSDCILQFLTSLEQTVKDVMEWYDRNAGQVMRPLTREQKESHIYARVCYLCKKTFTEKNYKVRDYCHISGVYTGAAHNMCNLQRRQAIFLPVLSHNLRKYSIHHIIKHVIRAFHSWTVSPIEQKSETFSFFTCFVEKDTAIRFIDSQQLISMSLDNAVKRIKRNNFTLTSTLTNVIADDSKIIVPYLGTIAELEQPSDTLPAYEVFLDAQSNYTLTREEYNNANNTYVRWNCKSLKDYYTRNLQLNVYLLADVIEQFRDIVKYEDGLEPLHFFSILEISWTAAMKMSQTHLEVLKDVEMYEWFESGIRDGMSFINKHYSQRRDEFQELLYIDLSNVYGWALSEALPISSFKWITDTDELTRLLCSIKDMDLTDGGIGYVLEIDVSVPDELHDQLDQLPLFPNYQVPSLQIVNNCMQNNTKVNKLIQSHTEKTNYVIHARLLQLYMELGARVDKVHRAVQFRQAKCFQPYIQCNMNKRTQTVCEFERNYHTLCINSLFAMICENIRKRREVKFCNTAEKLIICNSSNRMRKSIEIDHDIVAMFMSKPTMKLDKLIYITQAVLDLTKFFMYRLYYQKMMVYASEFDNGKINILGGDIDSLFLELQNISLHRFLQCMKDDRLLDTSNFHCNDPLFSNALQSKICCIRDECAGLPLQEIVLFQPKCYSLILTNNVFPKTSVRGVKRNVLRRALNHKRYKQIYNQFANCSLKKEENEDADLKPPLVKRQKRIDNEDHQT